MKGIVLISHGRFAEGLKESLEMLCGPCPQVFTVCLEVSDSPEVFSDKLVKAYEEASVYGKVVVLCDVMGGTPCNIAVGQLSKKEESVLLAGMNLPMLMTAVLQDMDSDVLVQEGKDAIADVLKQIQNLSVDCEVE